MLNVDVLLKDMKIHITLLLTGLLVAQGCSTPPPVSQCELHGSLLREGVVPVRYGLLAHGPNGPSYPNSNKFTIGGCVIGSVTIAKVQFCPQCRKADPDWNPDTPELSWTPSPEQIKTEQFRKRCTAAGISNASAFVDTNGLYYINLRDENLNKLSLLADLPVAGLDIRWTAVSDLSPITGKQIRNLDISQTRVMDLSPLSGMTIERLDIQETKVSDLSPLRGASISDLFLCGSPVAELSPLRDMPLDNLYIDGTKVTDLSPVANCPIRNMSIADTKVSDLTPVRSMPLDTLFLERSAVTDLSPLAGCPLEILSFSLATVTNGLEVIRRMSTLETINNLEASDFWKKYDAGQLNMEEQNK
jgi:hypothetical protein